MTVKLLHVEISDRGPIRYFASPYWTGKGMQDMPWHSVEDIWRIAAVDGGDVMHLLRPLREDWSEPRTVATDGGLLTIAPDFMAEGLFAASGDSEDESLWPRELLRARGAYRRGRTAALKAMLPGYSQIGIIAYAMEAMTCEYGPRRP